MEDVEPLFELVGRDGQLFFNSPGSAPFAIKGVNWFGSEAFNGPPGGLDRHSIAYYMDFLAKHDFNAVRLLFNHEHALKDDIVESPTKELFQVRYLEMFRQIAREAASRGILIMLACHRVSAASWPGKGLWFDDSLGYPEARVLDSWEAVASALCGEWNVFAADLQNEPHASSWAKGLDIDWNKGAERIGDHVLQRCPRWLIVVEGVGYEPGALGGDDPGAGYWWGENLVGVQAAPVQLSRQEKLVYSPHVYGPSVYEQNYFSEPGFPLNMPSVWDAHFGFAKALTQTPIVLGEFGGRFVDQDRQWQEWAIPYVVSQGYGLFYFALNPDSVDTGGLLPSNWTEPEAGSVEAQKLEALKALPSSRVFEVCRRCEELARSAAAPTNGSGPGWLGAVLDGGDGAVSALLPPALRGHVLPFYVFGAFLACSALYIAHLFRVHLYSPLAPRHALLNHKPTRKPRREARAPAGKTAERKRGAGPGKATAKEKPKSEPLASVKVVRQLPPAFALRRESQEPARAAASGLRFGGTSGAPCSRPAAVAVAPVPRRSAVPKPPPAAAPPVNFPPAAPMRPPAAPKPPPKLPKPPGAGVCSFGTKRAAPSLPVSNAKPSVKTKSKSRR